MSTETPFLLAIVIAIALLLGTAECKADQEFKYNLDLLPWSDHHGDHNATNEQHDGIGLSVTLPNNATYGLMHYTNSYGRDGWLVSLSTKLTQDCTVCLGVGIGFAPEYKHDDQSTIIGWGSISYKWLHIMTVPTEVTAIAFRIPLN